MFSSLWEKKDFRKICTKMLSAVYSEAQESLHFFVSLAFIITFKHASSRTRLKRLSSRSSMAFHSPCNHGLSTWSQALWKLMIQCLARQMNSVHLGALSGGGEEGQVAGKQTNQSIRLLVTNVCRSSKGPGRE